MSTSLVPPVITFDVEGQKAAARKLVADANIATITLSAKNLTVESQESYEACVALRNAFALAQKRITDFFGPMIDAANKLHKSLTAARAEMLKPYCDGKDVCTRKMERFLLDQKEAKRKADAVMSQVAEKERSRLADEAEDLMSMGFVKEAAQKTQQARMTMAPTLPAAVTKVAGAKVADKWIAECTDLIAFAKAIGEGKIPLMHDVRGEMRPILLVDQVTLNAVVSRQQDSLKWPGIAVKESVRISSSKL